MGIFDAIFGKTDNSALNEAIQKGAFLVDVRTRNEFAEGSVKGATNIPLSELSVELDAFKNKSAVVVFCRSGNRSAQAKQFLENKGISNVFNGGTWHRVQDLVKQFA